MTIENLYNTGATCTLKHYLLPGSGMAANGAGGGTPRVNGGTEAGTTVDTDGWSASITGAMKAGDCFTIANVDVLFRVTADVDSNGSGVATLAVEPPILAGSPPGNDELLTIADATLTAVILDYTGATAGPDQYIGGLQVTFREAP